MKCKNCGQELRDIDKFCKNCGIPVEAANNNQVPYIFSAGQINVQNSNNNKNNEQVPTFNSFFNNADVSQNNTNNVVNSSEQQFNQIPRVDNIEQQTSSSFNPLGTPMQETSQQVNNTENIVNQSVNNATTQNVVINSVDIPQQENKSQVIQPINNISQQNIVQTQKKENKFNSIKNLFLKKKKLFIPVFIILFVISTFVISNVLKQIRLKKVDLEIADSIDYYFSDDVLTVNHIDENVTIDTPADNSNSSTSSTSTNTSSVTNVSSNSNTQNSSTNSNSSINDSSKKEGITRTFMVYIVGSNLESGGDNPLVGGAASYDIQEMIDAKVDSSTKVYIYTGGASAWQNDIISADENAIYEISGQGIRLVKKYDKKNMGLSTTLSEFINYVSSISKTDKYDLILWNHGGGPIGGYGHDENYDDMLTLQEMKTALNSTKFKGDNKFEIIGFDACLMGSLEVATSLKEYAEYLVASEDTEVGSGWDYSFLTDISKLNTQELGKKIVDTFADSIEAYEKNLASYYGSESYDIPFTLSLIDLSKINDVVKELNKSFNSLNANLTIDYDNIAKTRMNSLEFGKDSSDDLNSFNLIDIYDFSNSISGSVDFSFTKTAIKNAVTYSKSNLLNASGLTIYFPSSYNIVSAYSLNEYKTFSELSDYYNFISNYNKYNLNNKAYKYSLKSDKYSYKNNMLTINLSKEEADSYYKASYVVFEKKDEHKYVPIYTGANFRLNGTKLQAQYKKYQFNISDGEGEDGSTNLIFESSTNKGSIFYAPVILIGTDSLKTELGKYKFLIKGDKITEYGIYPMSDDNSIISNNKNRLEKKDFNYIHFTYYDYDILDENGNYTSEWKANTPLTLYEVKTDSNLKFSMKKLDSNKEYYAAVTIKDLQGNIHTSDLIKIQ